MNNIMATACHIFSKTYVYTLFHSLCFCFLCIKYLHKYEYIYNIKNLYHYKYIGCNDHSDFPSNCNIAILCVQFPNIYTLLSYF